MWHSHPWHFAPTWNLSTAHTSNAKKWNQDPEDLAGNHWDSTQQLYEMWSNSNWRTFTYPAYFGKLLLLALEESPGWATTGMILKLSWMSWIGGSFRDLLPMSLLWRLTIWFYLEVSKTNQPPTGINKLRQCHWWLHCRARRSHLLSSILIPNRDAIEPRILGHFGKYGIMFGTNWNHFISKEPNSDLYTFLCDPKGAGQRIFYHQRMHLKGSFGPEFNGYASPKTELSANGEAEWATHVRRFLVLTIPSENPRSWPRPMEFGMLKLLGSESEKTWALGSTSGWAKNRTNSEWTKNAVSVPTKQKKQNKWLIHISSD